MLKTKRLRKKCLLTVWLGLLGVSGCSVEVKEFETPIEIPLQFSRSGDESAPLFWWYSFQDADLNRLIDQALTANLDLRAAFNRQQQAYAIARQAGAELVPALDVSVSIEEETQHLSGNGQRTTDTLGMGLAASYEIDLWGRIRAQRLAAVLEGDSAAFALRTTAISLSAQIATVWYQLIEQRRQLDLLSRQIATNEQYVDLVKARFQGAQASAADLFEQQQVLEAVHGDKFAVLANIEVLQNQLAVLTGRAPGSLSVPGARQFPQIPGLPKTGLTSTLLKRRPDIRQAYVQVQAADLRVAAAVAEQFPKLSLSASVDTAAPDLHGLFNNWLTTLAANLLTPIIDGGRRIAEVDRAEAVTAEAFNRYGQTVLTALAEVENSLAQERQQDRRLSSLRRQLFSLREANQQLRRRYIYGAVDFLRVLSSLIRLQSLERSVIQAERERIEYRINLYRSLAGDWPLDFSERGDG